MEDFVRVPKDLKGFVIGAKGSIIKSIQERSGARVYSLSRDEEGFRVRGTREERELAKKLILEKVEGGKLKFEQNNSNKICYFIDDFNLPVNSMLRLEKDYGSPLQYRLKPFDSSGTEESPNLTNDPIYFRTLETEVLHSLERIKHEIKTKRPLKADIWCHFGTVLIRQPNEGPGGEWSIENASRKLLEGTGWRTLYRGGGNLDEKFVEQHLCKQSPPEYEDVQSRYDVTFQTPNGGQLTFKVWVIKKNVGKTLKRIVIPFTDLKNHLDEVCFEERFTSSRCRGYLILPPQRHLRANILFPGCEFDCRLTIHALADSGFHMDFVPKDDIRKTLLRYLSKVTFSDEDDFGLRLPDEKLPDGFKLLFMRCSKRAVYSFSEEFSIVLSKGNTGVYGRDIQKGTDFNLHCKEWDELLNSGNWEPEEITKKLPDFFRFVKTVQSSIIHEMKHEGATATYCMKQEEEFVDVPRDLKGYVIGTKGNTVRSIMERSRAKVYGLDNEEGFWVKGTKEQREYAKNLILEMVEGGKLKFERNISNKICYFIDDFNLPVNTMVRLEKDYGPPLEYRLVPVDSSGTEESPSLANDPIYFKTLEEEVFNSLERIKHEIETKQPLKADICCQFGTVLIRQPNEGPGGEWSIENALRELLEETEWKTLFRGRVNLHEKFVEQHLCNQCPPEHEDFQSTYDLTFRTPNGVQLAFKVWVIKTNVGKTLESIVIPFTDLHNILDEVCFDDKFTSSRCRGWLILPLRRYLLANILFPGCEFDCRLTIRALADSGFHMDFVPEDDVRSTLLRYLSKVTFSDEDDFGLRLPDEKLPEGFQLVFMRCSKRAVYRLSEGFSIIISKESTGLYGRDIKKETDFYLHCKEWDDLLNSENWEPEEVVKKLPDFFRFVKKVQSSVIHEMKHEGATAKHKEEIADFVYVPDDLKRHVIGTGGNSLRSIQERSGAKMLSLSRAEEGFWVYGTKEQREYAKRLILEMVERRKFDQNKSNKLCYFIDDLNLPVNTMLRLEKYYEPPLEYRLRPFHSYGTEESPSLANDPIYFKTLEAEVLHSLQRIKHEIGTKRPLKANIWCQFGTVLIRQGDEGPGGEWSIENALGKLVEGSEWKTLFRGGVNLYEKFVEQRLCNQSLPEYEDYQSKYELTFPTPNGGQLTFKVWVMKKNVGKTLESIIFPFTDLKNILDEVCFEDEFTSSRCRGWFFLPSQRYLRADILFPGCEFDCRLTIRALADSGFHMDFVPEDDIRSTLLRYLSKVTFSDEDEFGLRLPDEKLPDGFKLSFMRCSKRTVYRLSEDVSIILSKESTGMYGRDIKKETDVYMYLYCKEWDELLNSENWEPEEVIRKLPDFFRFVKKVQSSIMDKMKHEGATATYCVKHKEKMADFVDVPEDLKGHVIGTGGNTFRSIQERSGAKVLSLSRAEEGFWVKGTREQKEYAQNLILEMVEEGKVKREKKYSNRIHCYIDDFNMPANTNLRLDKEDGAQAGYRLRSIQSYELEEFLSPGNDPIYFQDLAVELLHSLQRLKREMETKHHLKADIWCHFGTVFIDQPDEDTDREWNIENAVHKLLEGTKGKTVFEGGINFDEKFVEQHLGNELHPEYDDYLSRYDLEFKMPNGGELKFKVWVTKQNVGEKWEGIPIPYTEVKNILDEVDFHDPFTSSRCRGWLILRPQNYLRANILFPGCKFDCRLTMRVLADNARDMDLVPKEDTRNALLSYLSKVTFSDEDGFGLCLPDEKFVPDGFQLSYMRCSKRAKYRFSEDFSIILSKESTHKGIGVKKETDFHLHCKEWDNLLDSGNWEPAEITKKLPDFFRFVRKVQSSIIHEIKHEGASVPPEILARGLSAVESYFKALADGRTSLKRVPIMLIGQDRAGKTSLKKSLKGICFDPEEDSTVGIDVDPSYFKVTTDAFRTGTVPEQQDGEGDMSFDRHAAMKIVHDLRKGNESLLSKTSAEETKTPSDDEWERPTMTDIIQPERHTGHSETYKQMPKKDAPEISPFPSLHSQEALTDFNRILPEEIAVETETLLKGDLDNNREHVFLTLWDFAGQSVYYDTHPIFLTEQAIYCLVYDLSLNPHDMAKPVVKQGVYKKFQESVNLKTNLDYLDFWMWSVVSLAGDAPKSADKTAAVNRMLPRKLPPVFLVCTHADTPYDKKKRPTEIAHEIFGCLKSKPYGIHLSDVFVVDNTKSGTEFECPEVKSLREEVYDVAKGLPHVSETIPIKWLKFDKALRELKEEGKHFVTLERAKDIAKSCDIVDDVEFETVMNYLHDLRILIHFDDTPALNELVVLDMQWLIDVFKNVITVKRYNRKEKEFVDLWSKLEKEGILHEELLSHVWGTLSEKEGLYEGLITIMEKFSLLCLLSSENPKSYLVPSMLKTRPSTEIVEVVSSAQIPSLLVKFKSGKVPAGLFHRFVVHFFRWGKGTFLRPAELQLFQNVARFITCGDKICSVIFVWHMATVEVAIYAEDQQKATAYACASVICWQLGLMLESMRKEFFWLRNMRYERAVLCPVCCPGGSLVCYWDSHDLEGCNEEHGLHCWSLSELCSAKKPIVCTKSGLKKDVVVDIEQFSPWLPPSEQRKQNANGEPPVRSLSTGEESEERAIVLPCDLVESLSCQSSDCKQVVSQFKENLLCSEASLDNPDVETKALIRRFTREAKCFHRLDVVQHLREITPAGTTGPVLPENLRIQDMSLQEITDLTVALTVTDKWQLVAEKFGLNRDRIDLLNLRFTNPADALLAHMARQRPLTVGYVYDLLCECDLQVIADKL